jgi:Fe-S cluster biogenesis protein NfuA
MTTTIFGGKLLDNDIEQIRSIINAVAMQYQAKGGDIRFVGVEGGVVKIAPSGFCWR